MQSAISPLESKISFTTFGGLVRKPNLEAGMITTVDAGVYIIGGLSI